MSSPILSLAILRVNWKEHRKDYLDSFIPLIASLIPNRSEEPVDVDKISSDFTREFGLIIPYHAMVSILNRAKKRGLLRHVQHRLYPVTERPTEFDTSQIVREQTQKYNLLIDQFIQFAVNKFEVSLLREDAENALLEFVKDNELALLFAADQASLLTGAGSRIQHRHLVYRFIQEAHQSKPESFQYVVQLVVSHALASTVLYGQGSVFTSNLRGTNVYLDTPLIFQLLGLDGAERQSQTAELLWLLIEQDVSLNVFDHTHREVSQIVNACPDWLARRDYDPTRASRVLRYMKENNFSPEDAERIAFRLNDDLKKYEITVVDHPDPGVNRNYQIDEDKLFRQIDSQYLPARPESDEEARKRTIRTDVESIAAIYRLRGGRSGRFLRDSRFVFVTTNHVLVKAARDFDREDYGQGFRIPPAVTDFFVGTTVWMQAPAKVERTIEYRLLAECYAGVRPDGALLRKYTQEVEKLKEGDRITDDEYYALRTHKVAMELLADKTLGDPESFTDRTPEEVLDEIKGKLEIEANKHYQEEKGRHQETRIRLEEIEQEQRASRERVEKRADKMSGIGASLLTIIIVALFVSGTILQLVPGIFEAFTAVRGVLLGFTVILGCLSLGTGFNIKGTRTFLKNYLKKQILRFSGFAQNDAGSFEAHK